MTADLILTNGVVHTVDAARSVREAMAVTDGRILAVGSVAEIAELAGPGTRIVASPVRRPIVTDQLP